MPIRTAQPQDLETVYALMCELEAEELPRPAFDRMYAENLRNPWIRYLLAEEEGAVCGLISLHAKEPLHRAARVGEVMELIVAEPWRGRGIGKALLAAAQAEGKAMGCAGLELHSSMGRTAAHAFYQHEGWEKHALFFTLDLGEAT